MKMMSPQALLRFLLGSGTAFLFYGGFIVDVAAAHYSMSLTRSFSTPHTHLFAPAPAQTRL